MRSHPGGSRLNQLLIKLAAWQLAEQLHGNQASMGPHVEVLTHGKLTQKARQTESLELNRDISTTHRHTDTQPNRHTAKQTHKHTDTQTHRRQN